MPESSGYASHLSIEAVAFVTALTRKKQRIVLDLADQIARQPFQTPAFVLVAVHCGARPK